jgi:hypothetical protein
MSPSSSFERRVFSTLDAAPSRIPVILGGSGAGRTWVMRRLLDRIGRTDAQYIDVERSATTPERFLDAVVGSSPFPSLGRERSYTNAREAFEALLRFLDTARAPGGSPCTFLLDEVLELRTFESFPGLRRVLRELLDGLSASPNRFILSTRYVARAHRLLRDATARFEVLHIPPMSVADVIDLLAPAFNGFEQTPADDRDYLGRTVQALTDGRASAVRAIADAMRDMGRGADPISALAALLSPGGTLDRSCRYCYELRLHRARGYGALKAILDILADEEPLTLTEISLRMRRTPGSTKDYLSWLEDVDLIVSRSKRYSFTDPLLRLWVRLNCRPVPASEEEIAREVQRYALSRVPRADEPAPAMAYAGVPAQAGDDRDDRKGWGIIEID